MHLDSGYDSRKTRDLLEILGCEWVISKIGKPLQIGVRWDMEHTNFWCARGFRKLQVSAADRARAITAFISLAGDVIITRLLVREASTRYRWDPGPTRRP